MDYRLGDMVVFTDEHGKRRVNRIVNENVPGAPDCVGIQGTKEFLFYLRKKSDIRIAYHWEIHLAMFNNGVLEG